MTSLPCSPSEQKAGEEEGTARLRSLEEHPLGARFMARGELFCERGDTASPPPNQAVGVRTTRFGKVEGACGGRGAAVCPAPAE